MSGVTQQGRGALAWFGGLKLGAWARAKDGGALMEFAAVVPVLALLLLGGAEFARFSILNQKVDRVSSLVGDYVAQAPVVNAAVMADYFAAAQRLAQPFDLAGQGTVIVSTVSQEEGSGPEVLWQQVGGGGLPATSSIGTPGGAATLPTDFPMGDQESVVIAEVYYDYDPMFIPAIVPNTQVFFRSFYRPRRTAVLQFN